MQSAGLFRDFSGSLAYAYDLVANDQFSFRAGIQASVRSLSINFGNAITGDPGGPSLDPSLTNQRTNDIYGNVGAGLYATYAQRIYVGLSVPRIYTNTIGINPDPNVETAKESRHYYLMAGAILPINDDLKLLPAVLAKYVQGAPFDADLNVNLDIREKFTVGLSGRLGGNRVFETDALLGVESVDLIAFWQVSPLVGVGAAYDFTLSKVRDYTAGSFELLVQADLKTVTKKNTKSRKNLSNPRFFL
jgi:type IX secretion system PorP/SprF family membrane protein